jgi:elongator complex protein 3
MPGLPGSTPKQDLDIFKEIFENEKFRPDMIKIYPTLVVKGTKLYELWKKGEYKPLELHETVRLLAEMKRHVPPWVRIQRIERDIPAQLIEAGIKKSNLRQLIKREMERYGWRCQCIRCREVGHRGYKDNIYPHKIEIKTYDYRASKGKEIFISLEDKKNNLLIGYCRLRIPHAPHRPEFTDDSAIIREIKIHGDVVEIGGKPRDEYQHRGFGEQLIKKAERISREHSIKQLLILSGIGVKNYYYKLGFIDDGLYVSKIL